MKTLLSNSGYQFDPQTNVWMRPDYTGIAYNDGDEIEKRIASIVEQASDVSTLSTELREQCTDWPSIYHLSGSRANLLRPFQHLLRNSDILEIGAGCGAITRYLGECGANVLALEGSPRRAQIARSRTRSLDNITVLAEKFDDFKCEQQFDVITLIGVLEYANLFTPGEYPALAMLRRVRAMLKPHGQLIIAIENQLGLKYFAGAAEDHLGEAMYGIEGRYRQNQPQTYGRKVLTDMLKEAGFLASDFMAPFPDYKLPTSIVTETGFLNKDFDTSAFAWQSVKRDHQLPPISSFSPELVWPTLVQNGMALDLANSFLIVATASIEQPNASAVLAWHFTSERAKEFCKQTKFLQTNSGAIEVHYRPLMPEGLRQISSQSLTYSIPEKAKYERGQLLAQELILLVTRDGWCIGEVGVFLRRYLDILIALNKSSDSITHIDSTDITFPGKFFDALPQNIVTCSDGTYRLIDEEWTLNDNIHVGQLLFRSLLSLLNSVTRFGSSISDFTRTPMGFMIAAFKAAGFAVPEEKIESYAKLEIVLQAEVAQRPLLHGELLNWLRTTPLPDRNLSQTIPFRDSQIANLNQAIRVQQETIIELQGTVRGLQDTVVERDTRISDLDGQIFSLKRVSADQASQIVNLDRLIYERDLEITSSREALAVIQASNSWRITAPLRNMVSKYRRIVKAAPKIRRIIRENGGLFPVAQKAARVISTEGIKGIRIRLRNYTYRAHPAENTVLPSSAEASLSVVPYYIDPLLDKTPINKRPKVSIAIHMHLYYTEMLDELMPYLNGMPVSYDLYVSVPETSDVSLLIPLLRSKLINVKKVIVESVPNRGRDIAPLIIQFGRRLAQYDIIAHIHTKKSPHSGHLAKWCTDILDRLFSRPGGTGGYILHIIELLQTKAKIVYPEGQYHIIKDRTGWADNFDIARNLLEAHTHISIQDFPSVEFSEGSMFWARAKCLKGYLTLPLSYEDFPIEPIPADGTLAHALERLLLIFASQSKGECLRIHRGDSIHDYRYYEEQRNYSETIENPDIKVLSYYLPQFHPTPENDEWHGKGFTEWTKVQAANPLFEGHYQQHIPHPDIGYYLLDSPATLKQQADMMHKSGVYGQVFYHYWFSGKLILEDPAQMLLANPDIKMPFCFCWANENWTRRWDGNENEILLGQDYSADDARAFIEYLIPFFHDDRYITVDQRPVLFIYRPSSIPDPQEYLSIWESVCTRAGIKRPYVVAVLTRGANHPNDFGMDAGTERVLHDWTAGAVQDIRHTLRPYYPLNGGVLPYDELTKFYRGQTTKKDFTYFRSLVPTWDNTARYGSEALLLHGSTPPVFQEWLQDTIDHARSTLPADRRFVILNAWNEWAEGAHLEPDTRFGYSYLNSVGRALSNIHYDERLPTKRPLPSGIQLHLQFSEFMLEQLRADAQLKDRFIFCLSRSSIFKACSVISIDAPELVAQLPGVVLATPEITVSANYLLQFRRAALFAPDTIEKMIVTAYSCPGVTIISNAYGVEHELISITENGSIDASAIHGTPLVLFSTKVEGGYKNFRMQTDAHSFVANSNSIPYESLPIVTTIIRIHKSGDIAVLKNALYCLSAMQDCIVFPLIAAQDLSAEQTSELEATVNAIPWASNFRPIIKFYETTDQTGDLRSKMLNESLRQINTRYAAILDYDDLLMPYAYSWLISRMNKTGKAVSFGRVYLSLFDGTTETILKRRRDYEHGYTYDDFTRYNHAPVHSFLLDLEKLNLGDTIYFDDQRYMEDYLLTLQLFKRDNVDWNSLEQNFYIGDYIHSVHRTHTLALTSETDRAALLETPEYRQCEERIMEIKKRASSH